jgi:hypothetical protein
MLRARHVIAIIIAGLMALAYFLLQSSTQWLIPTTDIMAASASGICSILAFLVAYRWGSQSRFGVVHLGMFLGIFLWFLGDTTWVVYETILHISIPYPSFADIFYLAGYVPIAVGVFQFLRIFHASLTRERVVIAFVMGLLSFVFTLLLVIGPLATSSEDFLAKFFDVTYPVLDSILVLLAFLMVFIFRGGKMAGSWLWIAFGLLLNAGADILFSLGTLQGWYYSGHPIELVQLWAYIGLGLGFYEQVYFYEQLRS